MDYIEIEQIDLTDSEMLDVIREKMGEGWALSDYRYYIDMEDPEVSHKIWVFEKESPLFCSERKNRHTSGITSYDVMGVNIPILGE